MNLIRNSCRSFMWIWENEELLLKLTQSAERQTFNRFTPSPEEIKDIHSNLPADDETEEDGEGGLDQTLPRN
ncbi:MAG: hypothetical protein ACJZ72_06645 [Opitutales bacterium]